MSIDEAALANRPIVWFYERASISGDLAALAFYSGNKLVDILHGDIADYLYPILHKNSLNPETKREDEHNKTLKKASGDALQGESDSISLASGFDSHGALDSQPATLTKPVSISLQDCAIAITQAMGSARVCGVELSYKQAAKVVLDAAGVKYVD